MEEQRSPVDIVHKLFQDMYLSSTLWPLNYQLERKEMMLMTVTDKASFKHHIVNVRGMRVIDSLVTSCPTHKRKECLDFLVLTPFDLLKRDHQSDCSIVNHGHVRPVSLTCALGGAPLSQGGRTSFRGYVTVS